MAELAATADIPRGDRAFLGHPIGLAYLAFTEAWERFSFYGMQALLVLYMVDRLLRPGHMEHIVGFAPIKAGLEGALGPLSGQALASAIFGIYAASVYLTPLAGGLIGDRWIGRRAAVTLGAVLMAAGHFLMAFEQAFVAALALLILGCGFLKGNIASQVGRLYGADDPRRDDAFQIYVLGINAGVIAAPLVCGTLGELYGWHWGSTAAGVGMLIALGVYLLGGRYLPPDSPRARRAAEAAAPRPPLTARDWRTIAALTALIPILGVAFVGNNQIYNVYMIWARDNADLVLMGWRAPVTWLQSLDAGASVAGLAVVALFWRWMAARRIIPSELTKLSIGCGISVLGFVDLAVAAGIQAHTGVKVPLAWLIAFHVVNSIAYANLLPVALSQFSRSAPPAVNATMIGVFYLLFFMTNAMVGWIGGFYEKMGHVQFWLLHGGLCAVAAAVLVVLHRPLKLALAPADSGGPPPVSR